MTRKRRTRSEQKAATRAALIDAAAQVFARRGYHAASVEEIADEAGYSHGAVYSNFGGKEELFLALYEEYIAWRVSEIRQAHAGGGEDLGARVRAAADQWMERVRADPGYFLLALELTAYAARRPALREQFASRHGAVRQGIAQLYAEQAEDSGLELPLPAEELALVVQALGAGLAREWMNDPDAVRPGLYGDFLAWAFGAMRVPGRA
jgi:AcrR family transcriptional regulator